MCIHIYIYVYIYVYLKIWLETLSRLVYWIVRLLQGNMIWRLLHCLWNHCLTRTTAKMHKCSAANCHKMQWKIKYSIVGDYSLPQTQCNKVQHTTTHDNTLQHTATHCNTLQHTATHCNTLHEYGIIRDYYLPHTSVYETKTSHKHLLSKSRGSMWLPHNITKKEKKSLHTCWGEHHRLPIWFTIFCQLLHSRLLPDTNRYIRKAGKCDDGNDLIHGSSHPIVHPNQIIGLFCTISSVL